MARLATAADGTVHAFPDNWSDARITAVLARSVGPSPNATQASMATTKLGPLLKYLPDVGGLVGGMAGAATGAGLGSFLGPIGTGIGGVAGGMLGAGLGGGAGEANRQRLAGEPSSGGAVAGSAATQALLQGVGEGIARPLAWMGRGMVRTGSGLTKELVQQFPGTFDAIIANRLAPGRGLFGRVGSRAANEEVRLSAAAATAAREASAKAGVTITAEDLAQQAIRTAEANASRPLSAAERDALIEQVRQEANGLLTGGTHGVVTHDLADFSPQQAKVIKRLAATKSKAIPAAVAAGAPPPASPSLLGDIARGAKDALEQKVAVPPSLTRYGGTYGALERRTQSAMGARKAMKSVEAGQEAGIGGRTPPFVPPMMGQFILPSAVRGGGIQSRLGFGMLNPISQVSAQQLPRALWALLAHQAAPDSTAAP